MNSDISNFFPDSENTILFSSKGYYLQLYFASLSFLPFHPIIYLYIHACIYSSIHLWIRYSEGISSPVIFFPSYLVKQQGNICPCLPHIGTAESSWNHQVCESAPRQIHDLSPAVFLQAVQSAIECFWPFSSQSLRVKLHPSPLSTIACLYLNVAKAPHTHPAYKGPHFELMALSFSKSRKPVTNLDSLSTPLIFIIPNIQPSPKTRSYFILYISRTHHLCQFYQFQRELSSSCWHDANKFLIGLPISAPCLSSALWLIFTFPSTHTLFQISSFP